MAKKTKPTLIEIIIDALEDIKAKDIKVVNVANITSVSDHVAIASADSNRQTRALAGNVIDKVREAGYTIYGSEGEESGEWVLVDCGDVVVHIMQPAIREYYKLEELWLDGTLEFPKPKKEVREAAEAAKPTSVVAKKVAAKKKPVAKKGAAKKPASKVAAKPKETATKKPAAKKVAAKKPATAVAKTPAEKKVTAKAPATKVAATKVAAAKVPAAKKPAAKVAKKKSV